MKKTISLIIILTLSLFSCIVAIFCIITLFLNNTERKQYTVGETKDCVYVVMNKDTTWILKDTNALAVNEEGVKDVVNEFAPSEDTIEINLNNTLLTTDLDLKYNPRKDSLINAVLNSEKVFHIVKKEYGDFTKVSAFFKNITIEICFFQDVNMWKYECYDKKGNEIDIYCISDYPQKTLKPETYTRLQKLFKKITE